MAAEAAAPSTVPLVDRFPALKRLTFARRRDIPFVQQLSQTECGAACLAMVLGYFGKAVGLEEVRDVCAAGRDGLNALNLVNGAALLGLRGRGLRVEVEQLRLLPPGASILHWEFNHFVVLAKVGPRSVEIMDPASGRRTITYEELNRAFTGVALTFEPNDMFSTQERKSILYATVRDLIGQTGLLPRLLVISLVLQVLGLAMPVLTAQIIDRVLPRSDLGLLAVLLLGMTFMVAFESLGKIVRGHLLSNLRTVLDSRMTLGFLDHLVSLPYSFFQLRSAGDLITRLNSNSVVREHLTSSTLSGILDGLMVVIYLGILVVGSRAMALAAALAGALDVVVYLLCRGRQRELVTQALRAETKSHSYQVEMMTAMETLKATGCEHRAVTHWSNIFVDEVNVSLQRDRLSIRVDALVAAIRTLGPLGILATGTVHVLNGDLTLGTMLSLSAVAGSFLEPLARLVQTAMSLEVLRSYLERVNDVLQTDPEDRRSAVRRAPPLSGRIALDHVSFRYTADGPLVVDDVSLEIRPRQVVAIVGRSGAGKSTLANLILGLYRPSSGRILFDQFDLAGLDLRSVRQQFGIVNQNVSLFASTVRDNISLADPSMSLESVQKAARRACIHDDVEAMPLGYSTLLGDRGSSLSGGQRQRLALARALVREPAVLLLDEATSALDAATERKVQQSLDLLECTRVIIAHRLSTVRRADLILVMEKGRLVEVGDHATLVARGGHYAALVASQLESDGPGRLPA